MYMRASGGGGPVTRDADTLTTDDSNDSNDDHQKNSDNVVTTNDDPFSGGSGGKTGSEIMAEAGSPSSVATIDPHVSSVEEKMAEDGAQRTVDTFTDLASDGDDPNGGTTFDQVPNNEQGKETLQDTAESFRNTARKAQQNSGPENQNVGGDDSNVPDKATTAAKNAANAVTTTPENPDRDGSQGAGGFFASVFGFVLSLVSTLFGGEN